MRISDWSSDVCSSDLSPGPGEGCLLHSSPEFFRSDPMLDANLKTQLQAYLEKVTRPIEIVASVDDGETSKEMLELLEELDAMSDRSEEHTSELKSLMRISYAVFCLKKKKHNNRNKVTAN